MELLQKRIMFNIIVQMIKNLLLKNTKTTKMTMMLLATRDDEDDSYGSSNTRNHIEAKHIQSGGFQCLLCNAFSPTRHALKMHILRSIERIGTELLYSALNDAIKAKIYKTEGGLYNCYECSYSSKYKTTCQDHSQPCCWRGGFASWS